MEHVRVYEAPRLRDGVLIAAFAGWNDAAGVATWAVRFLVEQWGAVKCAEIDPEEFFVFTETRPQVKLVEGSYRRIVWPANEFFYHRSPSMPRDYLVLLGIEPHLRWKTFAQAALGFARECGVEMVISLGGLLADVAHTLPVRISGTASDSRLAGQLRLLRVELSRYEGPTGIIGVLNATCRDEGIPAASLWGGVPHYIAATPNPKVSLGLLDTLDRLLGLGLDLTGLERLVPAFETQVNEAVAQNPQVAAYVRQLEEREKKDEEEATAEPPELPSGEAIVKELEEFLRRRRKNGGEGD